MGIELNDVRFLLDAHRSGVDFRNTLTIGRQNLSVEDVYLDHLLRNYAGLPFRAAHGRFAEPLFEYLGAHDVSSIDASEYEGATIIQDLNEPIAETLCNRFSVVYEAGTLEHVFNFPVAMRNCMRMVAVGGHLLIHTPANNYFGHGFYQFSPELFYRVLRPENGFEIERMIALEYSIEDPFRTRWYEVADPAAVRGRVELINGTLVLLLVRAKRVSGADPLMRTPQQSDYAEAWKSGDPAGPEAGLAGAGRGSFARRTKDWVKARVSPSLAFTVKRAKSQFRSMLSLSGWARKVKRQRSFTNPAYFKPIPPP
ncbi:MAG: hypothetical protein ACAI43_10475 [Phycisphaerae bacterium]|nr:hypothetical protein [Tepidisphaeraceae bacterium]